MVVNVRHYLDCSWDKMIVLNGHDLSNRARNEILFWQAKLNELNFRSFKTPTPTVIGWVDAGAFAGGGILGKLKIDSVGKHRPFTADNLLLPVSGKMTGLATLSIGAQWGTSKVCQSLGQDVPIVRDKFDIDPSRRSNTCILTSTTPS